MEGECNFCDIGGYKTKERQYVERGNFICRYEINLQTNDDIAFLKSIGLSHLLISETFQRLKTIQINSDHKNVTMWQ
jgi:hypothetical protein